MSKKFVFLWKPYEEIDLSLEMIKELESLTEHTQDGCKPYQNFSWDSGDNELSPAISEYVSEKYNEYFFFIDFHSGYRSCLHSGRDLE